jgi:hypothetical protein
MKKLFIILALLIGLQSLGQAPGGIPQAFSYQWYQYRKYVTVDSGFAVPFRDTNWTASRAGFITLKPSDLTYYGYNGSSWQPLGGGGGSGTVTNFSAGDLSPLFTTAEATTTTTPALTFSLSNTTQYTVFGRKAAGSGTPSYITADSALIIDLHSQGYYDIRYPQIANVWSKQGDAGTSSSTNFVGTTDNVALAFRVNNERAGLLDSTKKLTILGSRAAMNITSASGITAIGFEAYFTGTTQPNSVFLGMQSGYSSTTGQGKNNFTGVQSGYSNTTGRENNNTGFQSGYSNQTGFGNNWYGNQAGYNNRGNLNNGFGKGAFFSLGASTATGNSGFGNDIFSVLDSSSYNTGIGQDVFYQLLRGNANFGAGQSAGWYQNDGVAVITKCDSSIVIGAYARLLGDTTVNEIVIAVDGRGMGPNTTVIGNINTILSKIYGLYILDGNSDTLATRPWVTSQITGSLPSWAQTVAISNSLSNDNLAMDENAFILWDSDNDGDGYIEEGYVDGMRYTFDPTNSGFNFDFSDATALRTLNFPDDADTIAYRTWVRSLVSGLSSYTFNTGLTEAAGIVKLGGTFTTDISITGASNNLLINVRGDASASSGFANAATNSFVGIESDRVRMRRNGASIDVHDGLGISITPEISTPVSIDVTNGAGFYVFGLTNLTTQDRLIGVRNSTSQLGTITMNGPSLSSGVLSAQAGLQFKDEGVNLGATNTVTSIDFTGIGLFATRSANAITVNSNLNSIAINGVGSGSGTTANGASVDLGGLLTTAAIIDLNELVFEISDNVNGHGIKIEGAGADPTTTIGDVNNVAGGTKIIVDDGGTDITLNATDKLFLKVSGFGAATNGDVLYLVDNSTGEVGWTTPGAGVADADYGDITVTGTGATWTIDNGVVSNAKLANSTISGISLGSNLANLTATDATLTFSGAYNGSTARTIGLNLGNANTWSAVQTFSSNPVIAAITNTGTLTLPTVTGTIVQYAETSISSNATWSPAGNARVNWYQITAQGVAVTTVSAPSGTPVNHNELFIRVKDDGTARAIGGWDAIYRAGTNLALPTTTTLGKTMYIKFFYNSADSKWDLVSVIDGL